MIIGSSAWCVGETRNVSVTIKNTGSEAWIDNGTDDFNVGVKWNAESNYNLQVDAGNLAPGATQTFNFTITAPSVSENNNLTFNVVKNGVEWFGGEFISSPITISALPVMTGTMQVCSIGATSDLSITGETDWVSYPTGGTITTIGNDIIHTFTSGGNFVTAQSISNARYLIVGGGGSGGSVNASGNVGAGGGGAGGLIERNNISLPPSPPYNVVIGAGGIGISPGSNPGLPSSFNNENALGGGAGGHQGDAATSKGKNGASGGGGRNNEVGGTGNQGNNGGRSTSSAGTTNVGGGGGGGFNSLGGNTSSIAGGTGGTGFFSNISSLTYAKGGNGGSGGTANTASTNSNANTGDGGVGATSGSTAKKGGNGASGIVIIRYTVPGKWTSSNPEVAKVNELSGLVTSVSNGTTNITYTNAAGCSVTKPFNVNSNPTATISLINPTTPTICQGSSITIGGSVSVAGSTVNIDNGIGAVTSIGTNWSTTIIANATTVYSITSVVSSAGCTGTGTGSVNVTLPVSGTTLSGNNDQATCLVNNNNFIHFYEEGGLLASINSNGQNLGNVTITSYVDGGTDVPACDDPSNPYYITAAMGRHWVIKPTNVPTLPVTVRLPFYDTEHGALVTASGLTPNPNDNTVTISDLKLSKYSDTNPTPGYENDTFTDNCGHGTTSLHTQTGSGSVNDAIYLPGFDATSRYASFSITSFSEFWLHGSTSSPLPVTLTNFSATCEKEAILNWTTASEQNSDRFIIEKSRNGQDWIFVAEQTAAGNSNTTINYSQLDANNWSGITYYRLRQIDFNGDETIYGPISTLCEGIENSMTVYPNPNSGSFTVEIESEETISNAQLVLTDMTGKVILSQNINLAVGTTQILLNNLELEIGTYLVTLRGVNQQFKTVKVAVTQ